LNSRPEDYWISLGENVIGLDVLAEGDAARQSDTYWTIAQKCVELENYDIFNLLDVGCNYGILKRWLRKTGFRGEYIGIDSNRFAIQKAREFGWFTMLGNIRKMTFDDQTFDLVVMKDVLEHLESIEPLRESFRVAHQYLIHATYLPFTDQPSQIIQHDDGYYTNTYNKQEIIQLAKECGFSLLETIMRKETNGADNMITVWGRDA
jgi:SAM-dependent methyltransferase